MDLRSRTRILELLIIAAMMLCLAPFVLGQNISIQEVNNTAYPNSTFPNNNIGTIFQGDQINFSANITSNNSLDRVFINITAPNGSFFELDLSNHTANDDENVSLWNVSYVTSVFDEEGFYNVTFFANMTGGNGTGNYTIFTNFTLNDTTAPAIDNETSNVAELTPQGTLVNFTINVTDNLRNTNERVGVVNINITAPNQTGWIYSVMTNGSNGGMTYNFSFLTTLNDSEGLYTVYIVANDSSTQGGDTVNLSTNFTFNITYVTVPSVTVLNVTQPNGSNQDNTIINITANITDNLQDSNERVSQVLANITYPNGSSALLSMTNGTDGAQGDHGTVYNTSFQITQQDDAGLYRVQILANDTSNNLNTTLNVSFVVTDDNEPNVTVLNLSPDVLSANLSVPVNITVNITDNVDDTSRVDTVRVNVTINDSLSRIYTLTNGTGTTYNVTVFLPVTDGVGLKNFTILVNDTAGNLNDTIKLNFTFDDNTPPSVTDISIPSSDDPLPGEVIMIQTVVSDNSAVDRVFANITIAGGVTEQQQIELFLQGGTTTIYNNTFANTSTDGSYDIRITANDTYIATPEFTKITGNTNASINISLAINALVVSKGGGGSAGGGGGGGGGAIRRAQNVGTLNPLGTQTVVKARQPITFLANGKSFKLEVATIFSKSVVVRIFTRPEQRYSVEEGQTINLDIDGNGPDFSVTYDSRNSNLITLTLAPFSDSPVLRESATTPLESVAAPQVVDETDEGTEDLATTSSEGGSASSGVSSDGAADTVGSSGSSSSGLKGLAVLLVLGVIAVGAYLYNRDGGLKGWKPAYAGSVSEGHKDMFKKLIDKVRK